MTIAQLFQRYKDLKEAYLAGEYQSALLVLADIVTSLVKEFAGLGRPKMNASEFAAKSSLTAEELFAECDAMFDDAGCHGEGFSANEGAKGPLLDKFKLLLPILLKLLLGV